MVLSVSPPSSRQSALLFGNPSPPYSSPGSPTEKQRSEFRIQQALQCCLERLEFMLQPDERSCHSWMVVSINPFGWEQERIVVLSNKSYFHIKFNFEDFRMDKWTRISLREVSCLQMGYVQSANSSDSRQYGLRVFFNKTSPVVNDVASDFRTYTMQPSGLMQPNDDQNWSQVKEIAVAFNSMCSCCGVPCPLQVESDIYHDKTKRFDWSLGLYNNMRMGFYNFSDRFPELSNFWGSTPWSSEAQSSQADAHPDQHDYWAPVNAESGMDPPDTDPFHVFAKVHNAAYELHIGGGGKEVCQEWCRHWESGLQLVLELGVTQTPDSSDLLWKMNLEVDNVFQSLFSGKTVMAPAAWQHPQRLQRNTGEPPKVMQSPYQALAPMIDLCLRTTAGNQSASAFNQSAGHVPSGVSKSTSAYDLTYNSLRGDSQNYQY